MREKRGKQTAFTLVEAIVAMGILSMVLVMIYQTFYSVLRVTEVGADAAEQAQRERIVLKTIEDALSGIVYYEQNQEHYAFVAETLDFNYPSISFVSRVPPDFIGNKEFGAQGLRRIEFVVEDAPVEVKVEVNGKTKTEIRDERALVMYQIPILQPIDATELEDPKRWVLGPGLDTFMVLFWSTINNEWLPDWEETNSVPTRLKFEIAFKLNDGSAAELKDIQKREIVIFSDTITQAMQNPAMPASRSGGSSKGKGKGKGSDRNSGPRKPTADQMKRIAEWRKKHEEAKKRGDGKPRYTPEQIARYRKMMAERAAQAKAATAARANNGSTGGNTGDDAGGGNNSGGSGGRAGNPGIPGWSEINDNLMNYNETLGQPATSLQDLVNAGYYGSLDDLPSPPSGTEWQVENGQVIAVPV